MASAGEHPDQLWLLLEGSARWIACDQRGRQRVLMELPAPTAVGVSALLLGIPMIATVEAASAGVALLIGRESLGAALAADSEVCRALLLHTAEQAVALARAEANTREGLETRLAVVLASIARNHGRPCERGLLLRQRITEQSLADTLGTVPRSVRRALSRWFALGWIERHKGWLVIVDARPLFALAEGG